MQDPNKLNIGNSAIKNGEIISFEVDADTKQPQIKSTTNAGVESITHLPKYNAFQLTTDALQYPSISIGPDALTNLSGIEGGQWSTAFGVEAARYLTSGTGVTAFGARAGRGYTTGISNTCVGAYAGPYDEAATGSRNTFIGNTVGAFSTTGEGNTGLGMGALYYLTEGEFNMGIGRGSLQEVTTGSHNIGIGYVSGRLITTGNYNTFLGAGLQAQSPTIEGTLTIGAGQRRDIFADVNGIVLGDGNLGTEVLSLVVSDYANLNFADDAAAAAGGVELGGLYHNSGAVKIRLV